MAKDEKHDEKDEKEREKSGKGEGKWRNDPLGGVFAGLILIVIASTYLFQSYFPQGEWFMWALAGIGVVLILDALAHSLKPEWKRPVFGKVIGGIVLIAIGMGTIYDFVHSWAVFLLGLGVLMLIYYIIKSYRA
ncbi:MAG: hypothetical protein HXS47_07055 [Theionarchaea archaeon]|nr:hypothetical protein [Theionarchaea archaeon]